MTTVSSILDNPLTLLSQLDALPYPNSPHLLNLLDELVRRLDSNLDHPAREQFLDQLSLDLPDKLIHLAYTAPVSKGGPTAAKWARHPALACLKFMCQYGNPKEVFLAMTKTISILWARAEEMQQLPYDDDSCETTCTVETGEWLEVMKAGLANALIDPLALVFVRVLAKSRNPLPFFQTFSQTIFVILFGFVHQAPPSLAILTSQILAILELAPSLRPYLELFLLIITRLLYEHSTYEVLPLARPCFVARFPRWKPSLDRIVANEAEGVRDVDEEELKCALEPLRVLLSPQTLSRYISTAGWEAYGALACVVLSQSELEEAARQGAFLIYTISRSMKWVGRNESIEVESVVIEAIQDFSQTWIHAGLYTLLSTPQIYANQEMVFRLAIRATELSSPELRFLVFRTMVLLIDQMHPVQEAETLFYLLTSATSYLERPKLIKALLNLLKERMALVPRAESGLWSPKLLDSIPGWLKRTSESVEELEVVVESVNLVYFLVKVDLENSTGIQNEQKKEQIVRKLIGPAERSLVTLGDGDGNNELRAVLRSLEFGLGLLKGLGWRTECDQAA